MSPEEFEDLMDSYFEGEMNLAEKSDFISLTKQNKELQEALEMEEDFRLMGDIENHPAKYKDELELLEAVKIMDEKAKAKHSGESSSYIKWIVGAGVVAVLLSFGIYVANHVSDTDFPVPDLPYEELFQPYPLQIKPIMGSAMEVGMLYYNEKDWTEARIHLNRAVDELAENGDPLFLIATMDIYENNAEKGLQTLFAIVDKPELAVMKDAIRYYQALATIMIGDPENGLLFLEDLENSSDIFVAEKTKLIKRRLGILQ